MIRLPRFVAAARRGGYLPKLVRGFDMMVVSLVSSAFGEMLGYATKRCDPSAAREIELHRRHSAPSAPWPARRSCPGSSQPMIAPAIDEARTTDRPPRRAGGSRPTSRSLGLRRALDLLGSLAQSDMRARYGRGPWQLIKWLIDPFALTGVFLAFVVFVLDRPGGAVGLSVACAVVPFQLVIATVSTSLDSTRARENIIANMDFSRIYIPAAAALTESMAFVASAVLLALLMAIYAITPTAAILWLPIVVGANVAFAGAIAYPAALFALWMPDLRVFAVSLVRTAFFLAPGIIPLSQIPARAGDLMKLNPLTGLFESYRSVLIDGSAPEAWMLIGPLGFAAVIAAVFIPAYGQEQAHLAKVIG